MSKLSNLLFIGLLLFPLLTFGQSISSNLKYINEQFSKYNKYQTSFRIDEYNKEIICEDKFGVLKAKFEDVEIRTKGNNIGIFCINSEDKCIRNYEKDGTLKAEKYNDYTMGLREDNELIPHINTVLDKFSEIRNELLGISNNVSNNSTKIDIAAEISNINAIFRRSSEYTNKWRFDFSQNAIIGETKNCSVFIPLNSGLSITYYEREGKYGNGWYFINEDKSIIESCTNFESNTVKTYEYLNNALDAKKVINSFRVIIENGNNSISSNNESEGNNGSIAEHLIYINKQFDKYNDYDTKFSIDNYKKQLVWSNSFGTNYAYLEDVEVRVDYTNSWIGIYCINGGECIWQKANSGNRSDYKEYTMSLKENDKMINHINKVAQKFEEVKRLTLGNSNSNSNSDDSDSPD